VAIESGLKMQKVLKNISSTAEVLRCIEYRAEMALPSAQEQKATT